MEDDERLDLLGLDREVRTRFYKTSNENKNSASIHGDKGAFTIDPTQPPTDTDIPDFLAGQIIFKMYVTCDVTVQMADYTPVKMGAMIGMDTSAVPLTVDEGVTLARKMWRDMYNGFGGEAKAIIYQERPAPAPVSEKLEKALGVARLLWGKLFGNK